VRADRYSEAPSGPLRWARKARERRLGGIPVKALIGMPWKGENPGEHPASRRAKHMPDRREPSQGSKPRSRGSPGRAIASAMVVPARKTACGFIRAETLRIPRERRRLRRVKSQERRRGETDPTGARKVETVKRVTKP
jgi:hypothetical protein